MDDQNECDRQIEVLGLGIDIGGTKIEGVALDQNGHVLATYRMPSHKGNHAVHDDTVKLVRKLIERVKATRVLTEFSRSGQELEGFHNLDGLSNSTQTRRLGQITVGLGIPGRVDSIRGTVDDAINLGIHHMDLAKSIEETLGLPVQVENDVNIAALGAASLAESNLASSSIVGAEAPLNLNELHDGTAQARSLPPQEDQVTVFINLGTGLAAGIIRNGAIEHGANGVIGEIGHIPVDTHAFPCKCGQVGCLETVASGSAVEALWPGVNHPLPDMIAKAQKGDRRAAQGLDIIINGIALAIQIVALTIDPNAIILGGGLTKTGQPLLDLVKRRLRARAEESHFIASLNLPERVCLSLSDQPIAAIGAALSGSKTIGPGIQLKRN